MTRKKPSKTMKPAPRMEPGNRPIEHVIVRDDDKRLHEVDRIIVTVQAMHRAGQIDGRQFAAAEQYKDAWDAMHSGMPCALDQTRMGGGDGDGSPSDWKMWGHGKVHEARRMLGNFDAELLFCIIGEGHTVKSCAQHLSQITTEVHLKYVGRRFRDALTTLAAKWVPASKPGRIAGTGSMDLFDPALTGKDDAALGNVAVSGIKSAVAINRH